MSRNFLIEQILMDEHIASHGAMTLDDVKREVKHGVHNIVYKKVVKQRIARGQYDMSEVTKEYKVTKDPAIYDADGTMFSGRTNNNAAERQAYTSARQLITLYDVEAGTFKTFKEYSIVSFDGIPVEH